MNTELHRAWLHQLQWNWNEINTKELGGALRPPVFEIHSSTRTLGRWEARTRTISISEEHIWEHPWDEVISTLRHEIAHQITAELLGSETRPHGERFKHACKMLQIEHSATTRPSTEDHSKADRILSRVRKLLALANSANEHEAATAMATANTLLLRYNLELPSAAGRPDYEWRRLKPVGASIALSQKLVASILGEFFFVEAIWVNIYNAKRVRSERSLELLGTHANLELAVYVHDFLHASLERLWLEKRSTLPGNRRSRKREFTAGVILGLRDRLRQERQRSESRGLIWMGDADLNRFFQERHPQTSTLRSASLPLSDAHKAGREAGEKLKIHKPIETKDSKNRAPQRLPKS